MHRFAIALVVLGCSSSEDSKPAAGDLETEPKAQLSTVTPPPPANDYEERCGAGDAAACREARLFAEGCLHGDGASCAEAAKSQPSEASRWLARACRRGHGTQCDDTNDTLDVETSEMSEGALAERIATVYRHSVADCFAESSAKPGTTVTVVVKRKSAGKAKSTDEALSKCLEAQMTGWVFPGVATVAEQVSVRFSMKKATKEIAKRDKKAEDAAIAEAISNTALMSVLTGDQGGAFGRVDDTDRGSGLAQAIDDVKNNGNDVARGGSVGGDPRERRNVGSIDSDRGNTKSIGGTGKAAPRVRTQIKFSVDGDGTTLEPNAVARRIRSRYLGGIKACHERALKQNPKLGGRVALRFRVGKTGKVTSASAKGFDPGVDKCIATLTRRWRFGAPKDADGNPASADFRLPMVLKPGS